ncbi:MAG: toxin-antitoxin system TumE family protein [Candidatus Entotheonellia bacterium]
MTKSDPLQSLAEYSHFVAVLLDRPTVVRSTVMVWSDSPYTGVAEGVVYFVNDFRLRLREEIDFDARLLTSYGYEIYQGNQQLYWYDDFPHPNDVTLAVTYPHHKHVPPDIKHNRVPAPEVSFTQPNLPMLIGEIEGLIRV